MTLAVGNPFPLFFDRFGRPLTGGKVYIGTAGEDPETHPLTLYLDQALTVELVQPVNTIGGLMTNDGNPVAVYIAESNYSIRVRDADNAEVEYLANAVLTDAVYQPLSSVLTTLASLSQTSFGQGLLTKSDGAAIRAYIGVVSPLPLTGGSMTGEILRNGAGAYPYMADGAYTVSRIFVTANGAPDPRTQNGDIWFEEEP